MLTEQKIDIAEAYLKKLRAGASNSMQAYYVRAAHKHGVPVERISDIARIPLNRVALIVKEG